MCVPTSHTNRVPRARSAVAAPATILRQLPSLEHRATASSSLSRSPKLAVTQCSKLEKEKGTPSGVPFSIRHAEVRYAASLPSGTQIGRLRTAPTHW